MVVLETMPCGVPVVFHAERRAGRNDRRRARMGAWWGSLMPTRSRTHWRACFATMR